MSQLQFFRSDIKLSGHKEWIQRYIKRGLQYPITLEIDPTNECPLACIYCSSYENRRGKEANATLAPDVIFRIIREAVELGVKSVIWTGGGEPLLNSAVLSAIELTSSLGMKNAMFTTGIPLTPLVSEVLVDHLCWIRFHLDGATPETYARIHNSSKEIFFQTITNIREFVELRAGKKARIKSGIGSVAIDDNIEELPALAMLAKKLGLDYFQYKHDLTRMDDSRYLLWWNTDVIPILNALSSELKDDSFSLQYSEGIDYTERAHLPRCHVHHLNTAVTADGRVAYCKSLRHRESYSLGNVNHQSLKEVFDGEINRRLSDKITPSTCGVIPCPYQRANVFLDELVTTYDLTKLDSLPSQVDHQDFI